MQTNIPSNLHANNEQVRAAPDKCNTKYYTEAMTFNLWNDMSVSLASVLNLHRSVQLKKNADPNLTIKLSQKQIKACMKQNGKQWCQECNKPGAIGRNRLWLTQRL